MRMGEMFQYLATDHGIERFVGIRDRIGLHIAEMKRDAFTIDLRMRGRSERRGESYSLSCVEPLGTREQSCRTFSTSCCPFALFDSPDPQGQPKKKSDPQDQQARSPQTVGIVIRHGQ